MFEEESGVFFNMKYFEGLLTNGDWDEVEKYLSAFTKLGDDPKSTKMFFEIRKQKYLEALDRRDHGEAVAILAKDLKVFSTIDPGRFKEMTMLVTLPNFRQNALLAKYKDVESARAFLFAELKKLIETNPVFQDKLQFPSFHNSRLRQMINQSLNWQHQLCKFPKPDPEIKTLFVDHLCEKPKKATGPPPCLSPFTGRVEEFPPLDAKGVSELYDLPRMVIANINQGSPVKSMDFHPLLPCLLLVGTYIGDVFIWEVATKERIAYRQFNVWGLSQCSSALQTLLASEYSTSVNRVAWSPDGNYFGVAFSKHIVQIYSYLGGTELRNHLEIDAHYGNVSDLAFATVNKQLCVITCGADKNIKVFDTTTGSKLFTFEGHEAPVYSVCPHHNKNIKFIFSADVDGKIKQWLYNNEGSRFDYDAPGRSCIVMASSADGTRLFSCGTNMEDESFLVEWNESEVAVKRSYVGLAKKSVGAVQFDTTRNKFLAAGDESSIKFWDMDNVNLLTTVDAEGGLPASPCVRFNKEGLLLAVSTHDNGIKVLASTDGVRLVRSIESGFDASRVDCGSSMKAPMIGNSAISSSIGGNSIGVGERNVPVSPMVGPNGDSRTLCDVMPDVELSKTWELTEISESSDLRSLHLPDNTSLARVMRLKYTSRGDALFALASNAKHKFWLWQTNEKNVAATPGVAPKQSTPPSGFLMTNKIRSANREEAVPCFDLSSNDGFLVSASGGRASLFSLMYFKTLTTFMPPPPAATSLAFHPLDNNIIVVGMDDSTILIYHVRDDKVKSKLVGHQQRVTGLAFSDALNVLVSSGADSQLCVWSYEVWEKQACAYLQMPSGRSTNPSAHTRVQFHLDQIHVLAIHESHVAVYDARNLVRVKQWFPPRESSGVITDATYSCDGELVYVSSEDGTVSVLVASTLALRCTINPAAYLPSHPSPGTYPVSLAANPTVPNQLALGLSDGSVHVLEPGDSDSGWGFPPPESGAGPSGTSATTASDPSLLKA